jgi:hypothetical protein
VREAEKLFVNMRVTRLSVIEMTRTRLTKLTVEHSENANLKERKSRLNQSSQTRLSLPHRVFLAKISPFVNPRHGIPVFQSIKTNPARADISAEVNKEADVLAVDRSSTG